ncbi:MAG: hypothetical protein R3B74_17700 [Nitrospirales bacterium]|nr:hypothetical protein [Nitrospirales bacterium]
MLSTLATIQDQQLANGGFPYQSGEQARLDSTSWAVIVMSAFEGTDESCARGRSYLRSQQAADGHLSISADQPRASWPTPLAIMAWGRAPHFHQARDLALNFLLDFSGFHYPKGDTSILGHDSSIIGWPWIAGTHSWVIPTAMAITALQVSGIMHHQRISQGMSMLLDRQLPHGGWNSGNTLVFGKELLPLPECTGIALQALAGNTEKHLIVHSLTYLLDQLPRLRTPISLGWALLGLGAWGLKPEQTEDMINESLHLQKRHGPYSLPSLALLLCAAWAPQGFHSFFTAPLITSSSTLRGAKT